MTTVGTAKTCPADGHSPTNIHVYDNYYYYYSNQDVVTIITYITLLFQNINHSTHVHVPVTVCTRILTSIVSNNEATSDLSLTITW